MALFPAVKRVQIDRHNQVIEILKISPLDAPNQTLIKSKELSDCVYKISKHFCQTKEYNKIGSLFLMSLDTVVKKKKKMSSEI